MAPLAYVAKITRDRARPIGEKTAQEGGKLPEIGTFRVCCPQLRETQQYRLEEGFHLGGHPFLHRIVLIVLQDIANRQELLGSRAVT